MKYITTLLVDDDYLVLQDLQALVDWQALGFLITGTATNGKKALELAEKKHPALIITDISMPVMDGFDFIETIQEKYADTYIIFISSYASFSYAQRAMERGIRDYILKNEITRESFTERLVQVKNALQNKNSRQRSLLSQALANCFLNPDIALPEGEYKNRKYVFFFLAEQEPLEKLKAHFSHVPLYGAQLLDRAASFFGEGGAENLLWAVEDIVIAAVLQEEIPGSLRSAALANICTSIERQLSPKGKAPVLVSFLSLESGVQTVGECRKHYSRLLPYLHFQAGFPAMAERNLAVYLEKPFVPVRQLFPYHMLKESLAYPEEFLAKLDAHLCRLFEARDADAIYMLYHNLILQLEELGNHMVPVPDRNYFEDRESLFCFFAGIHQDIRSYYSRGQAGQYSANVRAAIEYMKAHFSDSSLTVEVLASQVYLSASRLSVLFKQETGQTVNDFLTDLRISQAIYLLENSTLKIYEISERAGYKSAQYFSQIFSQRTGHRPLYFRQKKPSA